MKTTHMELSRSDIVKIQEILDKFPDSTYFELHREDGSGIGSILDMTLTSKFNDIPGKFTIRLVDVDSW